jgi:hypothetical protein
MATRYPELRPQVLIVPELGGPRPTVDTPVPTDFGPAAAARLEAATWEDWTIRVPPLDLQRAVSLRRGLTDRVALIDSLLAH